MKLERVNSEFCVVSDEELFLSGKALAELMLATLEKKAFFRFQVKGFSMSPFIRDGDVVTISPLSCAKSVFGKAVAFIHPCAEKLIIHRVIRDLPGHYLIKGDSLFWPDGFIPKKNLLGFVSKIERNGKKIRLGLGKEQFLIVFLSRERILPLLVWCWRRIPLSIRKIVKPIL
ncbi:MAG: S24/S26 family peptidase [Candidatus Omnitrophica bacterium]|nr:S24/S26 family peptidase [Candidatus Omnitrophota bacterium]